MRPPFNFEFKQVVTRIESDKIEICKPKREQKAYLWVRYIHRRKDGWEILQIYPTIKKWVIKDNSS